MLEMRDVTKLFGASRALDGVTLSLRAGEAHALIGENGAGKSTLMKVLSGVYRPNAGTMTLDGLPYEPRGPRDAIKAGVAMIYQELTLAPHLSVEANIMLGREQSSFGFVKRGEHRRVVRRVLDLLEHPEISPTAAVGSLSVGARQLVEVGRALARDARVIVFDEPTSSLTRRDAERLFEVIDRLKSSGLCVVYISHFFEEVRRLAERFTVLRDGRTVGGGLVAESSQASMIAMMVGRALDSLFPRGERRRGDAVLELNALSGMTLPRSAGLALHRGEVLGVAGLVGAGRTEMLRAIYGLDAVRGGVIRVAGVEVRAPSPRGGIARGLGFLSEDRKGEGLALTMSIEENVTATALGRHARWGWLRLRSRREAARRWSARLGVKSSGPTQVVGSLSGGNQQKVALARLLHQEADVLLLDEPTKGVDIASKAEIYRLIDELARQGRAVLMISSYLPELLGVCDRVAVMARGRLGPARRVEDWTEHAIMEEATVGLDPVAASGDR